jgi:hypothetical protein
VEQSADTNAAIWQSGEVVQAYAAEAARSEPDRAVHRRFMAVLLPFGQQVAFTFLDLGAGTGAASRESSTSTRAVRRYWPTSPPR